MWVDVILESSVGERREIARRMAGLALPVMLASSVLSVTNLIDVGMVRSLLVTGAGFTEGQMEKYVYRRNICLWLA